MYTKIGLGILNSILMFYIYSWFARGKFDIVCECSHGGGLVLLLVMLVGLLISIIFNAKSVIGFKFINLCHMRPKEELHISFISSLECFKFSMRCDFSCPSVWHFRQLSKPKAIRIIQWLQEK